MADVGEFGGKQRDANSFLSPIFILLVCVFSLNLIVSDSL